MTREEAIKMLEFLATDTSGNMEDETGEYAEFLQRIVDALDMAIAALREQPRWIPVTERLPEENGDYLCYCPVLKIGGKDIPNYEVYGFTLEAEEIYDLKMTGHKGTAWYWYDCEYGYCSTKSVTHWMPMPECPEAEV